MSVNATLVSSEPLVLRPNLPEELLQLPRVALHSRKEVAGGGGGVVEGVVTTPLSMMVGGPAWTPTELTSLSRATWSRTSTRNHHRTHGAVGASSGGGGNQKNNNAAGVPPRTARVETTATTATSAHHKQQPQYYFVSSSSAAGGGGFIEPIATLSSLLRKDESSDLLRRIQHASAASTPRPPTRQRTTSRAAGQRGGDLSSSGTRHPIGKSDFAQRHIATSEHHLISGGMPSSSSPSADYHLHSSTQPVSSAVYGSLVGGYGVPTQTYDHDLQEADAIVSAALRVYPPPLFDAAACFRGPSEAAQILARRMADIAAAQTSVFSLNAASTSGGDHDDPLDMGVNWTVINKPSRGGGATSCGESAASAQQHEQHAASLQPPAAPAESLLIRNSSSDVRLLPLINPTGHVGSLGGSQKIQQTNASTSSSQRGPAKKRQMAAASSSAAASGEGHRSPDTASQHYGLQGSWSPSRDTTLSHAPRGGVVVDTPGGSDRAKLMKGIIDLLRDVDDAKRYLEESVEVYHTARREHMVRVIAAIREDDKRRIHTLENEVAALRNERLRLTELLKPPHPTPAQVITAAIKEALVLADATRKAAYVSSSTQCPELENAPGQSPRLHMREIDSPGIPAFEPGSFIPEELKDALHTIIQRPRDIEDLLKRHHHGGGGGAISTLDVLQKQPWQANRKLRQ